MAGDGGRWWKSIPAWAWLLLAAFSALALVGVLGSANSGDANVSRWGSASEWFGGWAAAVTLVFVLTALLHELAENRRQREEQRSAEARRVTVWCVQVVDRQQRWSSPDSADQVQRIIAPTAVVLWRNAGAQPVYDVMIYVVDPDGSERGASLGTFPSCAHDGDQLELVLAEPGVLPGVAAVQVGLEFADEYGNRWRRCPNGQLEPLRGESPPRPVLRRKGDESLIERRDRHADFPDGEAWWRTTPPWSESEPG